MKIQIKCPQCKTIMEDTLLNMKKKIKKYLYLDKGNVYHSCANYNTYLADKKYYGRGIKCVWCDEIMWKTEPNINLYNLIEKNEIEKNEIKRTFNSTL